MALSGPQIGLRSEGFPAGTIDLVPSRTESVFRRSSLSIDLARPLVVIPEATLPDGGW
jgi:hypothetical protein